MRNIHVIFDSDHYARLLNRKPEPLHRYTELSNGALMKTPEGTVIITGNRTRPYPEGPSPNGFVMHNHDMLGYIKLEGRVKNNLVTVFD